MTSMPRGLPLAMPAEWISTRSVPAVSDVPNFALKSAAVSASLAPFFTQSTSVLPGWMTGFDGWAGQSAVWLFVRSSSG